MSNYKHELIYSEMGDYLSYLIQIEILKHRESFASSVIFMIHGKLVLFSMGAEQQLSDTLEPF